MTASEAEGEEEVKESFEVQFLVMEKMMSALNANGNFKK